MAHDVLVSVGTNYQRVVNIQNGLRWLVARFNNVSVSHWYVSAAVGFQATPYWNSMVGFTTDLDIDALKQQLRAIEDQTGRVRRDERGEKSRVVTLDLDIVAYAGQIVEPMLFEQAHLIVPLADLHPDWIDPCSGHSAYRVAWQHMEAVYRLPKQA
ncbi:MAG: 2-amino-4-hydroxy-6-hydroxymethyldihydropteridine diphosphokinase [Anaerolinea sp.]